jgi:hypothetical protein
LAAAPAISADNRDAIDILALEQLLDDERHVEDAGDVDHVSHFGAEEFRVPTRTLDHQ